MSTNRLPKSASNPLGTATKRKAAINTSSDFDSSGPFASKRPHKRRRAVTSRHPLANRSTNVFATGHYECPADPEDPSLYEDIDIGVFLPLKTAYWELHIRLSSFAHAVLEGENLHESPLDVLRLKVIKQLENDTAHCHPDMWFIRSARSSKEIANILSEHGWWSPLLLGFFVDKPVDEILLSHSIDPQGHPTAYLAQLFRMGAFAQLLRLDISHVSLSLHDISLLRLLPRLSSLNISSTNATNHHLLHLATHEGTLRDLNVSGNVAINDDCRVPLTVLSKLQTLHLRGTGVTVPCLRLLAYALPIDCRFVTLPLHCLNFLNNRHRHYCTAIPAGYAEDPRKVPNLALPMLKKNLELHKKANADILTTGSKVDLMDRLSSLLCARIADGRVIRRVGRGS